MAPGKTQPEAISAIGVTHVTYSRWKQEFGGLKSDQIRQLKELEQENARLRRAVIEHVRRALRVSRVRNLRPA